MSGRRCLEEPDEQLAGVIGSHLADQLGRQLVIGQLQRHNAVEQRRQPRYFRIRLHVGQHASAALFDVDAHQTHQLGEGEPPSMVGGALLDRITGATQAPQTPSLCPLKQVGQQPRLTNPRLALHHHQPTRLLFERPKALRKGGTFINTPEHQAWAVGPAGRLDRPIDGNRRCLTFDLDCGQLLEP